MKPCACEICDHDFGGRCALHCGCYGHVRYPEDCDSFDYCDCDDDDDDDDDDDEVTCPNCFYITYWDGNRYVCKNCGWSSD